MSVEATEIAESGAGCESGPLMLAKRMEGKPAPKRNELDLHPDARERFEKAVDAVMRSPPKPKTAKDRGPSPARGGKRGETKPA